MIFDVICPKCGKVQKYQPRRDGGLIGKMKKCVFCNKQFKILDNCNQLFIKQIKRKVNKKILEMGGFGHYVKKR